MVVGAAAAVGEGDGVVRGIFGFEGAACGRGMGICKGRRGDGVTEGAIVETGAGWGVGEAGGDW